MLVSVEAMKQGEGVEIDEPSSPSSRTSQVSLRQSIIQTLQKFGPQKYFAVPPFGCCFRPCVQPHHITAKQLLWVSRLVRQYVVMQVFVNAYFMWARFTLDPYWEVDAVADPLLKVSGMVAMYGLFVMYAATHELLHRWNTTRKFISVKAGHSTCIRMEFEILKILVFRRNSASIKALFNGSYGPSKPCNAAMIEPFMELFIGLPINPRYRALYTLKAIAAAASTRPVKKGTHERGPF